MKKEVIDREYVEGELKKYKFPGMGIGVIKDGKVLFSGGFGLADIEAGVPISGDTQFAIASCSKAFTATLLGMLQDEGVLELERPVREYLPDFEMYDPVATAQCTLKDMLTHRTGLGGYDALWSDDLTREDLWKRLKYLKPNKPFRSAVQYSNLIYAMAGHVAEKVTGESWDKLIKEKIFMPLGMTNSNTSITEMLKSGSFASPYWQGEDGPFRVENWNVDLGGPAAAINSTINDMLKWLQFNIDRGQWAGKQLISQAAMEEIHLAHVRYKLWKWDFDEAPPIAGYGMGWYNDVYKGHPLYFHIGEIEGYCSMQMVLPREKLGIVCFNNVHKPCILAQASVAYTIIDNVLELGESNWSERFFEQRDNYGYLLEDWNLDLVGNERVNGTELSHSIDCYEGRYYNPGHGTIDIMEKDGRLKCIYRGVQQDMEHYHYDVFRVPHIKMDTLLITAPLAFRTDPKSGAIDRFEFGLYEQVEPIVFKRINS
ncbi:MAG TPA: serine hydrolase [Bacillota bacterium]|nr:serine hydrolase [Bacillota bacterium]